MPSLMFPKKTSRRPAVQDARQAVGALPALRPQWVLHVLAAFAITAVLGGVVLLSDRMGLAVVTWVGCGLLTVLYGVAAARAHQRRVFADTTIEALNPILGARIPSRQLVQFQRWGGGWIGRPAQIRLRYAAGVNDDDPRFVSEILEHAERRLGEPYRVKSHNSKRCVMLLELADQKKTKVTPEVERAEKVAGELLGATARAAIETGDDGAVRAIDVHHDMGARLALPGYRARIEKVLSSMLPGRWRARWDLENDAVRFELRPTMPSMIIHEPGVTIPELNHRNYMASKIAYCTDEDGTVHHWEPSKMPHFLIVGGTGSGKTSAEHTLLTALALLGWRVWVLDGKRIEFIGFRDWPNVELVTSTVGSQVRMIHAAHELMEYRYGLIEAGKARVDEFDPLVVIIDEYATFQQRVKQWYPSVKAKGMPAQPPVFDLIGDIARLGRSAKVHLVVGIQRPDVTFLGGEMRDNFATRLSLGRLSPQGANMMWDSFAVGVVRTPRGRGVALDPNGDPVEVLTHYTPDPAKLDAGDDDQRAILDRLRPTTITYPRKSIEPPRPEIDPTGKSEDLLEPMYEDWANARIAEYSGPRHDEIVTAPATAGSSVEDAEALADSAEDAGDSDELEGYGAAELSKVADLAEGDLVLVDEGLELWGVVETVEPDIVDDERFVIDYRDIDSGDPNTIDVPAEDSVTVRRPDATPSK